MKIGSIVRKILFSISAGEGCCLTLGSYSMQVLRMTDTDSGTWQHSKYRQCFCMTMRLQASCLYMFWTQSHFAQMNVLLQSCSNVLPVNVEFLQLVTQLVSEQLMLHK